MKPLFVVFLVVMPGIACTTTETYTRTDKEGKFVDVYSTSDKRSALANPAQDSAVVSAVNQLQNKVKEGPTDVRSWLNLAMLQVAQGKLSEAEGSARSALRLDLKNEEARKILAQVAMKRGQYEMVEILLNSVGGVRSKDSQVLNMLALVAVQKNEPSLALDLFKNAIKLDAGNISARMNLGVLYLKYRQLHAAAIQFERVLRVMPENTDAMLHLAIIKGTRGDREKAEEMLETVLSRNDKNPLALFNLAVLQSQGKKYTYALDSLRTYLRTAKGRSQDTDQAFALLERIQEQQKSDGDGAVSDEEIDALAADLQQRADAPQHAMNHSNEDQSIRKVKSADDEEINELENALIE